MKKKEVPICDHCGRHNKIPKNPRRHFAWGSTKHSGGFRVPLCNTWSNDEDILEAMLFDSKNDKVTCKKCFSILKRAEDKAGGRKAPIRKVIEQVKKIVLGQTLYRVRKYIKEMGLRNPGQHEDKAP